MEIVDTLEAIIIVHNVRCSRPLVFRYSRMGLSYGIVLLDYCQQYKKRGNKCYSFS